MGLLSIAAQLPGSMHLIQAHLKAEQGSAEADALAAPLSALCSPACWLVQACKQPRADKVSSANLLLTTTRGQTERKENALLVNNQAQAVMESAHPSGEWAGVNQHLPVVLS